MKSEKKERKFILYIVIVILIAAAVILAFRLGCTVKDKYDAIKEENRKTQENIQKKEEEEKKKIEEQKNKQEADSFNFTFESWVGTQSGPVVSMQIDNVIKNNKKNSSHLIEVVFDKTSYGTDTSNIQSIKNSLKTWTDDHDFQKYEVSVDYDDNGYINKLTIETR